MGRTRILIVCFLFLSRLLGSARVAVVVGLVAFCIGCGGLIASMIVDGFVSAAIAARFAGMDGPQDLAMATILVSGQGLRRVVGIFGSVSALLLIVALLVAPAILATHVLLIGIGIQVVWYLALAVLLMRM